MQNLGYTDQLSLCCCSRLRRSLSVSEKALEAQREHLQQRQEGLGFEGDESQASKNATSSIPEPEGEGSDEEERAQPDSTQVVDCTQTHPHVRARLLRQLGGQEI